MNKKLILSLLFVMCFVGCDETSEIKQSSSLSNLSGTLSSVEEETYTVIWKNYDETILEFDDNVKYGSTPSYDGDTPQKVEEGIEYIFDGWSPSITNVESNQVYIATFKSNNKNYLPSISSEGKKIYYGLYPQSYVSDKSLVESLNLLSPEKNGMYLFDGSYFTKIVASTYKSGKYEFDDGTDIVNGETYWFRYDLIEWDILTNDGENYYLLSSVLLDNHNFYNNYEDRIINNEKIYSNNYEYSDIRKWLNEDFYTSAFSFNNKYVEKTTIGNNIEDNVSLLSYQEYLSYGFDNKNGISSTRECKVTEYARAKGAWCSSENDYMFNGSYWTRSSASNYYTAYNVNSGGYISEYAVDGASHCARPYITISMNF